MAARSETEAKRCRRCGAPLAGQELAGNCPRCLTTLVLSPESPEPAESPVTPDLRRLGDYQLIEEVARGGMGVVFRARQISLGREVAVKVLRDAWLATAVQVKRFRAEAANAAKLKHPNIVTVHEVGEQGGQHYFAMDLVRGGNLADATREGPLPPRQAAELVANVAAAVQHAHQQGVLHRDLKPSNVLLDTGGEPHVTDFGLARPMDDESSLTLTGQVLGTPGYIAPEQARGGGTVGPAADVYGLSAVLFHLLTGRAPFVGASAAETLTQVLQQEPLSPRLLNPAVPLDLAAVCLHGLSKNPNERYASAAALAEDLARFLDGQTTWARPASVLERMVRWGRRKPALAAAMVGLVAVGLAGISGIVWQWQRAEAEALKFQHGTYVADMNLAARALEDMDLGRARELLRRHQPLQGGPDLRNWEWRYLVALSDGDRNIALAGHSTRVSSFHFLDDNTLVSAGKADWRAVVWNLDERRASVILTNVGFGGSFSEVAVVSPKRNAMYYRGSWRGSSAITVTSLKTSGVSDPNEPAANVLYADAPISSVDISPNEELLAVAFGNQIGLRDLDRKTWLQPFRTESSFATQGLFSPDGRLLAVADESGRIGLWNLEKHTRLGGLTNASGSPGYLSFSADGRWLVNAGGHGVSQVWNVEARTLVAELRDASIVERAVFSPDGQWLATVGGDSSVRLWETAHWQKSRTLRGHTDVITAVDFSPRGHLLATGSRNGEVKLWPMNEPPSVPEEVSLSSSTLIEMAGDGSGFARIAQPPSTNDAPSGLILEVWTSTPLQRRFSVPLPGGLPSDTAVLAGCRAVVLGGQDGSLRVIGPLVGEEVLVKKAHKEDVYIVEASLDGSTLATKGIVDSVEPDDQIRIWRLPGLAPIAQLARAEHVHGIKLSDEGQRLVGFTGPGDMGVWKIPAMVGPRMWRAYGAAQNLEACAFSPDGQRVAAANTSGELLLWDLVTRQRRVLQRALTKYHSLSFSPDGARLAAGSEGESRVFDTATGQAVLSFKQAGLKLAFARDGERLLAVHRDGALVFRAPLLETLQFDWLKARPSEEAPPHMGPAPNYKRPDRP